MMFYMSPAPYTAPVRYYTDDVDDLNWIGSATISFRIIDFEVSTTLFDLGLNLNLYNPLIVMTAFYNIQVP